MTTPSIADTVAEALVRSRFTAWNRADSAAVRALLHVPHVSVPGTRMSIRESESALLDSPDFRALASVEGWHHSTLDALDACQRSADKVHCVATYGRYAADGRRYADGQAVYIATCRDGRWGIQLESGTLRPIGVGSWDDAEAVAAATGALERWIEAEDRPDSAALRGLAHLPFVELRGSGLVVHRSPATLRREVARRAAARTWHRSELRQVEVRERSAQKVTLEAEVARFEGGGAMLGCDAALAIVTELQGRWALQVHSAF
jgi:hypothetical protein